MTTHSNRRTKPPAKRKYRDQDWKKRRLEYLLDMGRRDTAIQEGLLEADPHHASVAAGKVKVMRPAR
jgi:hypothetical protein